MLRPQPKFRFGGDGKMEKWKNGMMEEWNNELITVLFALCALQKNGKI